ncbi:MAG: hypothetical protein U9N59_06685 [Campylobacterota bacterium]|nr:hypothetical protein [Campylobacterota bacterium]
MQWSHDINLIDKNEAIKFILSYIEDDIKDSSWKDIDSWRKHYNDYDIDLDKVINNYQEIFN